MPHNQIPSAFLIRALARREAEHCDRCGQRMFVKGPTGLCPFCRAERPFQAFAHPRLPAAAEQAPFAPRLGGWERLGLGQRLRHRVRRARPAAAPPAMIAPTHGAPPPHPS